MNFLASLEVDFLSSIFLSAPVPFMPGLGRIMALDEVLCFDWDATRSEDAVNGLIDMHKKLSAATGGRVIVPPTWTILRNLVKPHPLGGCGMAASPSNGVVDHAGRVFGYPGLFVLDGAIVPRALGLNPSKTIAALAERAVALMIDGSIVSDAL